MKKTDGNGTYVCRVCEGSGRRTYSGHEELNDMGLLKMYAENALARDATPLQIRAYTEKLAILGERISKDARVPEHFTDTEDKTSVLDSEITRKNREFQGKWAGPQIADGRWKGKRNSDKKKT